MHLGPQHITTWWAGDPDPVPSMWGPDELQYRAEEQEQVGWQMSEEQLWARDGFCPGGGVQHGEGWGRRDVVDSRELVECLIQNCTYG